MFTTYCSRMPRRGPGRHPWGVDHPTERPRRDRPPAPREVEGNARSAGRAADEASAGEARRRLREQGIVPIEPDDRIGVMLAPEELVVAVRRSVSLERRKGWREPGGGLGGDLYVTTRRLVHLGRVPIEYPLGEIREAVVAEGALRLVVSASHGVEIAVHDPCLLRVEIAAVREAARVSAPRAATVTGAADSGAPAQRHATEVSRRIRPRADGASVDYEPLR